MSARMKSSVTVIGHGAAAVAPDIMRITVSVEVRRPDVTSAFERAGHAAQAVSEALRASGVSPTDVSTTGLSVHADTVWQENKGQKLVGYIATTALSVTLRDLSAPGRVIADCVSAGGDDVRLGGLELAIADQSGLLSQARDAAFADARAKAEQYARLSGRELGKVVEVSENTEPSAVPRPMVRAMKAAADAMPIERGETELSASVLVRWTLS
ncbi:SIMPL domain-containing protein [Rhodococcus sp. NPDC058481]|uniref:SIMPL domain-containing protein n=1 Tax=unclassified Rhodococcus (in: high G+C Gram-positive bacteria) TaxID=192944 RepID=UPI003649AD33